MSTPPDALDVETRIAHLEQRDHRLTQLLELLAQRTTAPAKPGRDGDAYAAVIASFTTFGYPYLDGDAGSSECPISRAERFFE